MSNSLPKGPSKSRLEPSKAIRMAPGAIRTPDATRSRPGRVARDSNARPSRYYQQPQVLVSSPLDVCFS